MEKSVLLISSIKGFFRVDFVGSLHTKTKFLEFFTEDHQFWAHLDIAGVAFGDDEFAKSKHATAFGVHLLTTFIENLVEN